ncbi:MAG: hypothetical protein ACYDED_13200 [Ferrimicrobium sp.]
MESEPIAPLSFSEPLKPKLIDSSLAVLTRVSSIREHGPSEGAVTGVKLDQ